ncbi:MAG: sulfatase-like hydrolase/transferase [Pirellulales bacterium]|nr:sulfatase-like hydrolase/transferase [Pirellulales bacterium]
MNRSSENMRFFKCTFVVILAVGGSEVRPASCAQTARRPNILLIMADDLGVGDLSSFGAVDLKSPNVDKLIQGGMRFTNFYANCPVCSPTRASTLTGRYPDLVGVPGVIRTMARENWGYLSPQAITLPQLLRGAGYQTTLIGKWHLGLRPENHPCNRGFDFFHGFLGDMMDDYYRHRRHGINYMRRNFDEISPAGHATDLFTDWTIETIKTRSGSRAPWFVFLSYNAPHTPIQPPDDWLKKVKARRPEMDDRRARLVALIEHMDAGIGRIMQTLDATGEAKRTLIVFVSDNGGQLAVGGRCGPYRGGKQDMYEGGIRIPAGMRWPGRIEPGTESERITLTMDLLPTLCEAAGADVHRQIDGISFLPTLEGALQEEPLRTLFFVRREGNSRYQGQDYYAVRQGDWKLVHNNPHAPLELYNLKSDPKETLDLADKEVAVFKRLTSALRVQIQRAGAVPWQSPQ